MGDYLTYLRARILWNHLDTLSLSSEEVARATTLSVILNSLISETETSYYEYRKKPLSDEALLALQQSLDRSVKELSSYLSGTGDSDFAQDMKKEKEESVQNLAAVNSKLESIAHSYKEVIEFTKEFDELAQAALSKVLPALDAKKKASYEVLAVTIEASLLKLSAIRNRLQASLYTYTPPGSESNSTTIGELVEKLISQYSQREEKLVTQEKSLQIKLNEYETMLTLLDDKRGGFAQVVEDLARTKKETEACKKDLRRLGWMED